MIKDRLRMAEWLLAAAILLCIIAWIAPQQLAVVVYKVALVSLFAHLGYWIARRIGIGGPSRYSNELAQAIILAAVILAGAMAL